MTGDFHVFNPDVNVSPSWYRDQPEDSLFVTKIFDTIQGEGPHAGTPATFIRLSGCNRGDKFTMGCQFCDTDFRLGMGKPFRFDYIINELKRKLVVITGGEPMIQNNLTQFVDRIADYWMVQIESNGDRLAKGFGLLREDYDMGIELVVSPKVGKNGKYKPLKKEVIEKINCIKWLIDSRPESPYYAIPSVQQLGFDPDPSCVYLSPITVYKSNPLGIASMWDPSLIDMPATSLNYRYAAQLALEYGFNVSIQQHLFLGLE